MSSYELPSEYSSPYARDSGVPSRTSGTGMDQSQSPVDASGTLDGGVDRVLFESPVNVVDRRNVCSVVRVDFPALGVDICGGAIGRDGIKMCVKPMRGALCCTTAKHRNTPALFVPTIISPSQVYVLITVSDRNKNEVWITTSATFEKVGERYEQSWQHDTRTKGAWTDLLAQSHLSMNEDDPDAAAAAEQVLIDNHDAIAAAGGVASPRKRTREEARLEGNIILPHHLPQYSKFDFLHHMLM